jgi:hypothetical protein
MCLLPLLALATLGPTSTADLCCHGSATYWYGIQPWFDSWPDNGRSLCYFFFGASFFRRRGKRLRSEKCLHVKQTPLLSYGKRICISRYADRASVLRLWCLSCHTTWLSRRFCTSSGTEPVSRSVGSSRKLLLALSSNINLGFGSRIL